MVEQLLSMWQNSAKLPFDVFLRQAPVMAHSIDEDGIILNVSELWASALKFRPEEMIGRPSIDLLAPDSRRKAIEVTLPQFRREGVIRDVCYSFMRGDGSTMNVLMSASTLAIEGDFLRSIAVMFHDENRDKLLGARAKIDAAKTQLEALKNAPRDIRKKDVQAIIKSLDP